MTPLLIGIDAAAQLKNCGFAIGELSGGIIRVIRAGMLDGKPPWHGSLDNLKDSIRLAPSVVIAIDAPLGWPSKMASALSAHSAGELLEFSRQAMFMRETDIAVWRRTTKKPMEVGADKIAHAAHHAVELLSRLRELTGEPIPLAWEPAAIGKYAIEVYPGATLASRALAVSGYKKNSEKAKSARRQIADALKGEIPDLQKHVEGRVDVFDACLCLLAAQDFLEGKCPGPKDMGVARREGWIWVRDFADR